MKFLKKTSILFFLFLPGFSCGRGGLKTYYIVGESCDYSLLKKNEFKLENYTFEVEPAKTSYIRQALQCGKGEYFRIFGSKKKLAGGLVIAEGSKKCSLFVATDFIGRGFSDVPEEVELPDFKSIDAFVDLISQNLVKKAKIQSQVFLNPIKENELLAFCRSDSNLDTIQPVE